MSDPTWVVHPGAGDAVWIGSFGTIYKVPGETTGGSVAVVEHVIAPGVLGAPPHRHAREDETSYVLEGELTVQIGPMVTTLRPGAMVVKPRAIFHTFWNADASPARFLEIISPAGFERYFRELAALMPPDGPPDMDEVVALAGRYGLEFDLAAIPVLREAHRLRLG